MRLPWPKRWRPAYAVLLGAPIGVGLFTFRYAEGLSYFSSDPRACQICHPVPEAELKARAETIQSRNHALLGRASSALVSMLDRIQEAKASGAKDADLAPALKLRK